MTVEVKTPQPQIAVILAAGSSSRFVDGPKQLARLNGQSLVAIAAQAALDAGC
ncbi:MAG: NTP transferase domain-containing protein, partial [Actinobacteria bacterium]|nr:NTP transferase domain-containing protein [Actinomycetota bacterium]MSY35180.1 NTP transferase domain-containing protein [Actinomycetota bacterium]